MHSRIQGVSALCILALNIIIDKIYLVLWFWLVLVTLLGTIRVVCRVFQVASANIRYGLMEFKMHR